MYIFIFIFIHACIVSIDCSGESGNRVAGHSYRRAVVFFIVRHHTTLWRNSSGGLAAMGQKPFCNSSFQSEPSNLQMNAYLIQTL